MKWVAWTTVTGVAIAVCTSAVPAMASVEQGLYSATQNGQFVRVDAVALQAGHTYYVEACYERWDGFQQCQITSVGPIQSGTPNVYWDGPYGWGLEVEIEVNCSPAFAPKYAFAYLLDHLGPKNDVPVWTYDSNNNPVAHANFTPPSGC
jgi:hypothetical protein